MTTKKQTNKVNTPFGAKLQSDSAIVAFLLGSSGKRVINARAVNFLLSSLVKQSIYTEITRLNKGHCGSDFSWLRMRYASFFRQKSLLQLTSSTIIIMIMVRLQISRFSMTAEVYWSTDINNMIIALKTTTTSCITLTSNFKAVFFLGRGGGGFFPTESNLSALLC